MVTENPTQRGSSRLGALSTELNLVPFIDLLSSLVLFLLVTAVWLQISVIPASTAKPEGTRTVAAVKTEDLLKVHLSAAGVEIIWPESAGSLTETLAKVNGEYPWALLKESVEKNIAQVSATYLSSEDGVPYGNVIQALDQIKSGGGSKVSLKTE